MKKEWHELGLTEISTVYGRPIRLYNAERTLCDMFRQRNKVDADLLNASMKRYLNKERKECPTAAAICRTVPGIFPDSKVCGDSFMKSSRQVKDLIKKMSKKRNECIASSPKLHV